MIIICKTPLNIVKVVYQQVAETFDCRYVDETILIALIS